MKLNDDKNMVSIGKDECTALTRLLENDIEIKVHANRVEVNDVTRQQDVWMITGKRSGPAIFVLD